MKKLIKPLIILAVIGAIIAVVASYGMGIYRDFMKDYKGDQTYQGEDFTLEVPMGASAESIGLLLKEHDVITYEKAFAQRVKDSQYNGKIKYGTYTITKGMTIDDMIALMSAGDDRETLKFTIPEGYSIEMIAAKLDSEGICTKEDFLAAVEATDYDYDFLDFTKKEGTKYYLQGFLFPATYEIFVGETAHDIVNRMLKAFENNYTTEMQEKAKELGMSNYEIVTIASIIEREAKLQEERPTISGVIYNRLDINMKLQMCPTVLYPLTDGMYDVNQVLYDDLEIESPYNTYKYEGLPVGPICSPGAASLGAAVNPESHSYLFYHTDNEETGSHIFSETYEEHQSTR